MLLEISLRRGDINLAPKLMTFVIDALLTMSPRTVVVDC